MKLTNTGSGWRFVPDYRTGFQIEILQVAWEVNFRIRKMMNEDLSPLLEPASIEQPQHIFRN